MYLRGNAELESQFVMALTTTLPGACSWHEVTQFGDIPSARAFHKTVVDAVNDRSAAMPGPMLFLFNVH